jgi:nucleotide-binding universal stress UspA family protein
MKNILLPTDFSDNSWNAIKYGIQLFENEDCVFHLFHTYTPVIYHAEHVLGYPAQFDLGDIIKNTAEKKLSKLILKISNEFEQNPKHKFETKARFDTLISGIIAYTNKHAIEMIIMGTKGATAAEEVLFGSNTVHVFKDIKCPVLAIPSDFKYEAPHEILFPTDLEINYSNTQINCLHNIAVSHHSRVNAMHVSEGYDLTETQLKNKKELELLFKHTAFLFHDIKTMAILDAINTFQIKAKINLLVMINNKHSFFENLFFKSTINQIGFHLNIPFLVIPSKD